MAKVLIHNPIGPEVQARGGVNKLPPLRESGAGVLENGKQNAEFVMSAIVEEMSQRFGVIPAHVGHTRVAPTAKDVLEEATAKSDWVLVGSAD